LEAHKPVTTIRAADADNNDISVNRIDKTAAIARNPAVQEFCNDIHALESDADH
jgi:hypothetical protein